MYLSKALDGQFGERSMDEPQPLGGVAGWLLQAHRWWRERSRARRPGKARRRLFLLESLALGPRQRVVLMRCGRQRYLVGLGAEGVSTIVPVDARPSRIPPIKRPGETK